MSNSYNLYEKLAKEENLKEEAQVALNIAEEVHEVKKNYIGVIEGMEDIMGKRIEQRSMNLKDIVEILKNIMYAYINKNDLDIQLDFIIREDVKIQKHYYIMSILRNLLMNGLESIGEGKGNVEMTFEKLDNFGVFKVKDTGRGIKDKNLEYIFHPGFSTKFKEGSGDIKRGIGLTLVKDIVEKEFKGKITVSSDEKFTEFKVVIPLVGGEII
jgi:two-component system sensor histidine kinase YcbA